MTLTLAPPVAAASPSAIASPNSGPRSPLQPWVLPPRTLSVFYGAPRMPRLSHYFLPRILSHGERILFLDGANQIDPLLIARFARERGKAAATFNRLIRVSRAFTCFQLTELIARSPGFLEKFPAAVVIVTALPDLYFDEDVRDPQALASYDRALEALAHLASKPVSVAVFSDAATFPTRRKDFFPRLLAQAGRVLRVEMKSGDKLTFTCEKAAAAPLPR
jgi:hypothetical protein